MCVFFFFFCVNHSLKKAHAPPSCVRCRKFVSRYINIPNEGVVCVDCGAPKCASCQQQIVQGHCVSFRKEKFHADCFVCSLCKGPLGDQFMMVIIGFLVVCFIFFKKNRLLKKT